MVSPDDLELTRRLECGDVPPEGFPHASHLRVAWAYLSQSASLDEAVARMTATLRRFTASVGKADKYSEPTTVFWMLQLAAMRAVMPGAALHEVLRAYPRLLDKNLIRPDEPAHVFTPGSCDSPRNPSDRSVPRAPA